VANKKLTFSDDDALTVARRFPFAQHHDATLAAFAIRALAQRINDDANEWFAPLGLTAAKYNYLVVLYTAPNRTRTLNDVVALVHTATATVTVMMANLERDGYVKRRPNADDKRSVLATLTAKGVRTVEQIGPVYHANLEAGMSELSSADRAQLLSLLLRVNAGFDKHFDRFQSRADGIRRRRNGVH
jgi:MarR family 2-MHQ and catechol resistance regulon transcriptional repressor